MNHQNKVLRILTIVFSIIGGIYLVLGLCLTGAGFIKPMSGFQITGLVFLCTGAAFLVTVLVLLRISAHLRKKVERLKNEGIRYNAEIIRMYYNYYTRINWNHPLIVECVYKDNGGRSCLVKSRNIWPDRVFREEDVKANVYVNRNDPRDYFVEVTFGANPKDSQYDYDYR